LRRALRLCCPELAAQGLRGMAAAWPSGTADCAARVSAAPVASVSNDSAEVGSSRPACALCLQRAGSPDADPAGSAGRPAQRPPPTALRRDWRAHLRADCLARVRSDRGALLRQLRARGGGGGGGEDGMHALLSGVIAEVAGAGAARAGRPSLEQAGEGAADGVGATGMELQFPQTPAPAAGAAPARSSRDMAAELWDWSVAPADVRRAGCQRAASPSGARPACTTDVRICRAWGSCECVGGTGWKYVLRAAERTLSGLMPNNNATPARQL